MTYRNYLNTLKEEISATKIQYSALAKEISDRACKGEDIGDLVSEHNKVFSHFNDLFRRHVQLIQFIREQKVRLDSDMPDASKQESVG